MEERGGEAEKMETQQLFKILDALNRVSHHLKLSHDSPDSDLSAIKALLELRTASSSILSSNPLLFSLSRHLSQLADSVQELHNSKPSRLGLFSFVTRRVRSHEVSRLVAETESELHALIDRETVANLTKTLSKMRDSSVDSSASVDEDKLFDEISALQERLSRGFNIILQDLLLKSGVFAQLEWVLCNHQFGKRVREKAAVSMKELVLFNKDVFVGSVLVGGSVKALVSMDSLCSLQVLSALIKAIKSPLVDEMEYCGGILKIVGYLSSYDLEMRVMAMDCVMEIAYFGRKEAVEMMINGGLIQRLVELQSAEWRGKSETLERQEKRVNTRERVLIRIEERRSIHLQAVWRGLQCSWRGGEGLRQREKRAFKQLILNKIREACVSDAECATIVAEVLWGSLP